MTMYGPMEAHVVALIDRASRLTHDEARELANAWSAARVATWGTWGTDHDTAWDVAWDAPGNAARAADRGAAWVAVVARASAWGVTDRHSRDWDTDVAQNAVLGAAAALVVRDLVGQSWTQAAYDKLTGPWRRVIGPCHPDDLPLDA